jgi:hypothetical protein
MNDVTPFDVEAETVHAATVDNQPPPEQEPRPES